MEFNPIQKLNEMFYSLIFFYCPPKALHIVLMWFWLQVKHREFWGKCSTSTPWGKSFGVGCTVWRNVSNVFCLCWSCGESLQTVKWTVPWNYHHEDKHEQSVSPWLCCMTCGWSEPSPCPALHGGPGWWSWRPAAAPPAACGGRPGPGPVPAAQHSAARSGPALYRGPQPAPGSSSSEQHAPLSGLGHSSLLLSDEPQLPGAPWIACLAPSQVLLSQHLGSVSNQGKESSTDQLSDLGSQSMHGSRRADLQKLSFSLGKHFSLTFIHMLKIPL